MRRLPAFRLLVLACVSVGLLAVAPARADAQWRRGPRGPFIRSVIVVGPGFYDPFPFFWDQYPYPYPYPPYPPYGPYPPYYGYRVDRTASIRLQITPRETEVYVDGYRAGIVDDFDGVFQRLRIRPGEHDLVLYLDGYETVHQHIYVNPGSDQKIAYTMAHLAPGEAMEPRPVPAPPAQPVAPTTPPPPGRPLPPGRPVPTPPTAPLPPGPEQPSRFGTLIVRVQPADAEILIDGEKWASPGGPARLVVQLSEGRHHIEIRKEGYETYRSDLDVKAGETTPLNVSLLRGGSAGE